MFGSGLGTIELTVPHPTYAAGEETAGTVRLTATKPVKARYFS